MDLTGQNIDRRHELRTTEVSNNRTEVKFPGVPTYQFKMRDLSTNGAGLIARTDSNFLNMIHVGQKLEVRLISFSHTTGPSGRYQTKIKHVSEIKNGRFRGHMAVGLSFINKIG
jgi:hypothetical protein